MNSYLDISYPKVLQNEVTYWLWKKFKLCKKGYHLFNEIQSSDESYPRYSYCDVCGIEIYISGIVRYPEGEIR
jgi:hypothetical protein